VNSAHGIQDADCDLLNLQVRNSEITERQFLRRSRCDPYHELRNVLRRIKAGIKVAGGQFLEAKKYAACTSCSLTGSIYQ
jgi:hypothetical protein